MAERKPPILLHIRLLLITAVAAGCAQLTPRADPAKSKDVVLVVHGVDGAGPWYNSLIDGLRDGGVTAQIELVNWGAPLMILPNLQMPSVHHDAESKLARRIKLWRQEHPDGRLSLIGHSGGCGVILATLAALPADCRVDDAILLAPAVSPGYSLAPSLAHMNGTMHSFYSDKDQTLLKAGTSVGGTYDGVWGKAAGLNGFDDVTKLAPEAQRHFRQVAYDARWDKAGNNGDHFGWRKREFIQQYIAPLVLAKK